MTKQIAVVTGGMDGLGEAISDTCTPGSPRYEAVVEIDHRLDDGDLLSKVPVAAHLRRASLPGSKPLLRIRPPDGVRNA